MEQRRVTEFVEENVKTIFAYALSRVSNVEDAKDLTNDIVVAILQSADKIRNPDAFYGYLWGIATNTYRKFMRKKSHFVLEELEDTALGEYDFISELLLQEDIAKLRLEIALLSKEYRECTVAYYYEELSCIDIAHKLNISLEMVKYYLFKTRKILKEGICMEREFGEKSFKPAPFEFVTIFSGNFNREYQNLFSRKLPGQILMSAYYVPMTVRELAIELGVASVYLEDEIELLEKYGLITKVSNGKYQTNLIIFTDDFTQEFYKKAEKLAVPILKEIMVSVKNKLEQIWNLNKICKSLSEERLLWGLLWPVMRQGYQALEKEYVNLQEKEKLYDNATGTNYGTSSNEYSGEFGCYAFAGYSGIDENYYASGADFGILPEKNWYFQTVDHAVWKEKIYQMVLGEIKPECMILTKEEEKKLFEILSTELLMMKELYKKLFLCACQLMHIHAPKSVSKKIEHIVFQTLFFRTVGLLGACAVKSGELALPNFDGPVAIYVCENTKNVGDTIFETSSTC